MFYLSNYIPCVPPAGSEQHLAQILLDHLVFYYYYPPTELTSGKNYSEGIVSHLV